MDRGHYQGSSRRKTQGIAVCIAVYACGGSGGDMAPRAGAQALDSAGVRIVISAPDGPAVARWRLEPEPALLLGAADGPPEVLFEGVQAAVRLSDGSIAVADGGSQEIRIFDSDGGFRRRIGRRGGGPGEFRALRGLTVLPGDTLVAYDARGDRISYFSPDGELLRDWTPAVRDLDGRVVNLLGPFDDGSFVAVARPPAAQPVEAAAEGTVRDSMQLLLVRADVSDPEALGWTPAVEYYRVVLRGGGQVAIMNTTPPLWRLAYVAAGPHRIFVGHSGSFDIHAFVPGSEETLRIRLAGDRAQVESHHLARWKGIYATQGEGIWREVRARAVQSAPYPETPPAHGELFADRAGNLWVSQWRPPGETSPVKWWVFGPGGSLQATVEIPAGMRVLDAATDYVLLLKHDVLEIPYVVLYRIVHR